ncbi:MAG: formylglycine-generating enzyme family protein [Chloroflexi bacterium]|nr:formylglycine-generating enzyme family protein [Chloroflexota bacterium]MCI0577246.1 formylglycine-generating enzyme family protein [Chloroflexota bacterium]MCI0646727.1 formylglycine-generating enzyme family protein [Chloroflexota bacterium]MCI0731361.1 formylglycine-generating enzyme family protein [Chloroflexota bacterium]
MDAFEFSSVTLNEYGEIVARPAHRARLFVEKIGPGVALEMVLIPPGRCLIGTSGGAGHPDEYPQHLVEVDAFLIGRYPITQAQWLAIMGSNPARFKGEKRPVEGVSWLEAEAFCRRLSKKSGRAYRLPAEAEWEYACRAGSTTAFAYGETITAEVANYNSEYPYGFGPTGFYRHETTEVDTFPPNAFGLHDMHGNVWEWCADWWHDSYEGAPAGGRAWTAGGKSAYRAARGGSWHDTSDLCRSAARLKLPAGEGDEFVGFRVVCEVWE